VHLYDIDNMPDSFGICQRAATKLHDDHLQLLLTPGFEQAMIPFLTASRKYLPAEISAIALKRQNRRLLHIERPNLIFYPGSRRDLNAPAIRLISFSIAGAFESKALGSQACAFEMPAYALCIFLINFNAITLQLK